MLNKYRFLEINTVAIYTLVVPLVYLAIGQNKHINDDSRVW